MKKKPSFLIKELSVIVPAYNAQRTLGRCLEHILAQSYRPKKFEVIVVNDGSIDKTAEVAKKYPIRLIDLPKNQGRINARNIGVKNAKFKFVLFIDSDCEPDDTWVYESLKKNYEPIQGQVTNVSESHVDRFFFLMRRRYYIPVTKSKFITRRNFFRLPKGLGNFLCSKELYQLVIFTNTGELYSDDQYLINEIGKHKRVLAIPKSIVHHNERESYIDLLRQWYQRGSRFADFYFRKGGILEQQFKLSLVVTVVSIFLIVSTDLKFQNLVFFYLLVFLLLFLFFVSYLAERIKDVPIILFYLPTIIFFSLLGIARRQLKWTR